MARKLFPGGDNARALTASGLSSNANSCKRDAHATPRQWPPRADSEDGEDVRPRFTGANTPVAMLSHAEDPLASSCPVLEPTDFDGGLLDSSRGRHKPLGGVMIATPTDRRVDCCRDNTNGPTGPSPAAERQVDLVTRRQVGLLISTLFAGALSTCLKRGLLPLIEGELEMASYQVDAAKVLLLLPWSYSFLWGFLSDVVPLLGSRRKAYVILGWTLSLVACFAMAVLNYSLEYNSQSRAEVGFEALERRAALINAYMLLLMLASFGVILALEIGETYVIAQTRREPLPTRGRALGSLLLAQFVGECVGQIVADKVIFHISTLGLTPLFSFRQVALFFMFYALLPLAALLLLFHEEPEAPPIDDEDHGGYTQEYPRGLDHSRGLAVELEFSNVSTSALGRAKRRLSLHWTQLRAALGKESTSRVVRFFMIFIFLSEFTLTYPHERLESWVGMTPKAESSGSITVEAMYVLAVAGWKYCALGVDWRWGISLSLILGKIAPQTVYFFLAIFVPSTRSLQVYTFATALRGFLRALLIVLEVALSAELTPVGGEGAFVGVVVSMGTIMRLLATTFSNALGAAFDDDTSTKYGTSGADDQDKNQVAFALGLCNSIQLLALVALLFLPAQKQQLQRLHHAGGRGATRNAWWVLLALGASFLVAAVFNSLAISPATSCLRIVGGHGCD